ncbi:MAG: hypothetical protein MJ108_01325 [Saccharofermentans sp.]|nr:hypothetical protein [Saccharofermentans sp.]
MDGFALFFAVILGLPCGIGVALYLTANKLDKSNNFGDSKGDVTSFSPTGIEGKFYQNKVKKNTALDPVRNPAILAEDAKHSQATNSPQAALDNEINNANVSSIQWHK